MVSVAVRAAGPEAVCPSVMAAMARYSPHTDDIALLVLLVLRRAPEEPDGSGPAPSRQQVTGLRRIERYLAGSARRSGP